MHFCFLFLLFSHTTANDFTLQLRSQKPTEHNPKQFRHWVENQTWKPQQTAIVVCDFWDQHHCLNAVRRMKEFGPRLNRLIIAARDQGATIIHSPSDCMPAYSEHPSRKRAATTPFTKSPKGIQHWCSRISPEEQAVYPIDQSDGGEDDDPKEHQQWSEHLKSLGRNPNLPWKRQNQMIPIDPKLDYITDKGQEVWNILQARQIRNV
ncbi:MAG: nicotinamidase, partial [Planctomycetota bacterium]|nr:nicotinamidase [Planctomycetota bacterium]